MFNIKDFTSSINTKGVLKNNKYIATITLNDGHYLSSTGQSDDGDYRLFSIRCDSVQLPGVSLASADGPPRLGYGPIEKHPYNANFEDIALTFMVDANSQIHKLLYNWVNVIVNFQSRGGQELRGSSGPMRSAAYEVGYRDKYAALLQIDVYRDVGSGDEYQKTMTYKAFNAFPMAFPSAGLNWNEGDILKLSIPFAYTDFSVEYKTYNDSPIIRFTESERATELSRSIPGLFDYFDAVGLS